MKLQFLRNRNSFNPTHRTACIYIYTIFLSSSIRNAITIQYIPHVITFFICIHSVDYVCFFILMLNSIHSEKSAHIFFSILYDLDTVFTEGL
jgi:hypothetical protein